VSPEKVMGSTERRRMRDARVYVERPADAAAAKLFAGPGEMLARCRSLDWAATPLGPVDRWPTALRSTAQLVLRHPLPTVVLWGPELVQIYNEAYRTLFGDSHPAGLGQSTYEWLPEIRHINAPIYDRVWRGESVIREDVRYPPLAPSGDLDDTSSSVSYSPVYDDAGCVSGVLLTILEKRPRLRAGTDARESDRLLATVLELLPVGVGVINSAGAMVLSNAEMHRYLPTGIIPSSDEARRWRWRATKPDGSLVEPDDFPTARALRGEIVLPGLDMLYTQDDGREIWTRRAAVPIRDAEGRVTGAAAVVTDIDALKRTAEALRQSEARFRTMAELSPALLWEIDSAGVQVSLNSSWMEYTGQPLQETQSRGWLRAIHPDDRPSTYRAFEHAFTTGEPLELERRIRRHDGVYRWFLVRHRLVRDDEGRVARWLGAAVDIHAQRKAREEAERLVAKRTVERNALRQQLAAAEEAERRHFARELHDQLGQHLTAFTLVLAEARRLLDAGQSATERLKQLETLARVMTRDARYLALELRPPELDDVGLDSALQTYVEQWSTRYGVAAELEITGNAVDREVPNDVGSAVYRIVQEALTNVAKHADARHVSVLLDRSEGELRMIVEDDGGGFDPEVIRQRVRTKRGLGLVSMQERGALVGGQVDVESTPGNGTAIFFRVPWEQP
jgi:PAS domain S-box-containing protein